MTRCQQVDSAAQAPWASALPLFVAQPAALTGAGGTVLVVVVVPVPCGAVAVTRTLPPERIDHPKWPYWSLVMGFGLPIPDDGTVTHWPPCDALWSVTDAPSSHRPGCAA